MQKLVPSRGLEPVTFRLTVERVGIEPLRWLSIIFFLQKLGEYTKELKGEADQLSSHAVAAKSKNDQLIAELQKSYDIESQMNRKQFQVINELMVDLFIGYSVVFLIRRQCLGVVER
jgi:hypothetical protein